jgi:protein arginine kinase
VEIDRLVEARGEWMRGEGPEPDIVMSSRIRLARNVADFPFLNRADDTVRAEIERSLRRIVVELTRAGRLTYLDVNQLEGVDRQFLVERQLISRELAESHGSRGVCFNESENVSLMINEEDHLRIQVLRTGYDLDACWQEINALDDLLEERVRYAFSEELGYLTACPTNVGTGIRVSVLMHLPALVHSHEIRKVFQALQKINLAVRGLYGEGSQAMGDFYQISNQITLGESEEKLIRNLQDVVPGIISYERKAREQLLKDKETGLTLRDKIARAYGTLKSAQSISSEETMHLLSSVRMGINLKLIEDLPIPVVNELFIHTQPAHLQKLRRAQLDSAGRNVARAAYLRARLSDASSTSDN